MNLQNKKAYQSIGIKMSSHLVVSYETIGTERINELVESSRTTYDSIRFSNPFKTQHKCFFNVQYIQTVHLHLHLHYYT